MKEFRGKRLLDREAEIRFFLKWFEQIPDKILWIYGPKSSGKTTLIEYVVEKKLFEDVEKLKPKDGYWVKYLNLRRKLITSYNSFLEAFIKPKQENKKKSEKLSAKISLGIFEVNAEILNEVKKREKDLFDVILDQISKIEAEHKILIIDEIQTLEEIYINGDRELLKEFLNFCVSLTKETHLSHVVILSSNTIFIDRIYNDAKLKKTSEFYKIDHLEKSVVVEWLTGEGFSKEEIDLIWEYLGGCIPDIQDVLRDRDIIKDLKEYLDKKAFEAYTQIVDYLIRGNSETEEKIFRDIAKIIIIEGYFILKDNMKRKKEYIKVIDKWAEKEILFLDPLGLKVTGNSRIYEKGMERLVDG